MDLGLAGKRAVVAGSSAGLGLASARALAQAGARVVVSGRDHQRLDRAVAELAADGLTVVPVAGDVSNPGGAADFIEEATGALGGVDILVPNAGGPPPGTFASTDLDGYRAALDLNMLSAIELCRRTVPAMQAAGWGRVVAITSIGARQPIPTLMASVAARSGLTGFLKVLATEVAPDGVTVNSVQPGLHQTDRLTGLHGDDLAALAADVPARTVGDPADFGAVVAFLCSTHAAYVTGSALPVDGGANRGLQ